MFIGLVIPTKPGREKELKQILDGAVDEADQLIVIADIPRKEIVARINQGAAQAKGDFIMTTTDRTLLKPGWRVAMEKALAHMGGSGVVSLDTTFCGTAGMTRDFYENELGGNFFHPDYLHYFPDLELGEVARHARKYIEVPDRELYKEMLPKSDLNDSQDVEPFDKETWHLRTQKGFPLERIRTDEQKKKVLP